MKKLLLFTLLLGSSSLLNGSTLGTLKEAIDAGNIAAVTQLLANGIDINSNDAMGMTPLHYAVGSFNPQTEMVTFLLSRGADCTAKNHMNQTPLESVNWMIATADSFISTDSFISDEQRNKLMAIIDLLDPDSKAAAAADDDSKTAAE